MAIKQSQNLSWRSSLESIISELSHSVKDLLRRNIASVHQLEVLLLLKRTPERGWLPDEIGLQLYTNVSAVLKELEQLHVLGFVETSEQGNKRWYRYCAQTPELDEAVNEVAEAYRSYRFRVIDAIFSRPHDIS